MKITFFKARLFSNESSTVGSCNDCCLPPGQYGGWPVVRLSHPVVIGAQ